MTCRLCRERARSLPDSTPEFCEECWGEIQAIVNGEERHTLSGLLDVTRGLILAYAETLNVTAHIEAHPEEDRDGILAHLKRRGGHLLTQHEAAMMEMHELLAEELSRTLGHQRKAN